MANIIGTTGNNTLIGAADHDTLIGNAGNDSQDGAAGNDLIYGGEGNDSLFGGLGNDTLYGDFGPTEEMIVNGTFSAGTTGWTINNPTGGYAPIVSAGVATFNIISEDVYGDSIQQTFASITGETYFASFRGMENNTGFADHTVRVDILDANGNIIYSQTEVITNSSNRLISFDFIATTPTSTIRLTNTSSTNTINSDLKIDNVSVIGPGYKTGNDRLLGGDGDDVLFAGAGNDLLNGNAGNDTVYGGDGDDGSLTSDFGDDLFYGGAGNDSLSGDLGNDTLYGDQGHDVIEGHDGVDIIYAGDGNDYITGGDIIGITDATARTLNPLYGFDDAANDYLDGGIGDDTLLGGSGDDTLLGGNGKDALIGDLGNDSLAGGGGQDTLYGGAGTDALLGGAAADILYGDAGDDNLALAMGDVAFGGDGDDVFAIDLASDEGAGAITVQGGEGVQDLSDATNNPILADGSQRFGDVLDLRGLRNVVVTPTTIGAKSGTASYLSAQNNLVTISYFDIEHILSATPPNGVVDGTDAGDLIDQNFVDAQGEKVDDGPGDNDQIIAGAGNDIVNANLGDDTVQGGAGDDSLYGGAGNDSLLGGDGNDLLEGWAGNDTVLGDDGDDRLSGNAGDDRLFGGLGLDTLQGNDGNDSLDGGAGNDSLISGAGNDSVDGGDGDDIINTRTSVGDGVPDIGLSHPNPALSYPADPLANDDRDLVYGGAGIDTILTGDDRDTAFGGAGHDSIDVGFDDDFVDAGDGNDSLAGNEGRDTIYGGAGDDTIFGALASTDPNFAALAALDLLDAGGIDPAPHNSTDLLYGDTGSDRIYGGEDADRLYGGADGDALYGDIDNDLLFGDDGNDRLYGGQGVDLLSGGEGDDRLDGGSESDLLFAGAGNDLLNGNAGNDTVYGGDGDDGSLTSDFGDDLFYGGAGNDSLSGDLGNDTLYGDLGHDVIEGHDGVDIIYSGDGNDYITGSDISGITDAAARTLNPLFGFDDAANDYLDGGSGDDTLLGGSGDDTLTGAAGADIIVGGDGADVFVVQGADTITDFNAYAGVAGNTAQDNDFVDLSAHYNRANLAAWNAANPGNQYASSLQWLRADQADGILQAAGGVQIKSGGAAVSADLLNHENTAVCFVAGTRLATAKGHRPIEKLQVGDLVETLDHGLQPIRWIGTMTVCAVGDLAPIRICAGALQNRRDIFVSPQHRMLVSGWQVELLFGESQVLAAAKMLVNGRTIVAEPRAQVDYFHLMFDQHEIIFAEGAASESFHPGIEGFDALGAAARAEIIAQFPYLAENDFAAYGQSARRSLRTHEARLLKIGSNLVSTAQLNHAPHRRAALAAK